MTEHERSVLTPEVHSVSFAEGPRFAVLAWFHFAHPRAVPVGFEAVLPDRPERIAIDITLVIFATDGGAGGDRAVNED